MSFSEMAVLVFVCQEHGKWRFEERRKDARRAGRMPVRVWCMLECPVGVPCVGVPVDVLVWGKWLL
ncbi:MULTISPECIES: hypothetical protein [unclassified Bartonella]|uniref:hypothetical protein n=1 Tax=unclassified Bartonella TaxID=2645622 RepID=UPI0035CF29C7